MVEVSNDWEWLHWGEPIENEFVDMFSEDLEAHRKTYESLQRWDTFWAQFTSAISCLVHSLAAEEAGDYAKASRWLTGVPKEITAYPDWVRPETRQMLEHYWRQIPLFDSNLSGQK